MPVTRIRPGHPADFADVVEMSRRFWDLTIYDDPFDEDHVGKMVALTADCDLLLVVQCGYDLVGFIAGVAVPLLGNAAVLQVTEIGYWIEPDHRGRGVELLDALERAAMLRGAKYLNMIAMESSRPELTQAIYRRRGYRKVETTWCKRLEGSWPSQLQS